MVRGVSPPAETAQANRELDRENGMRRESERELRVASVSIRDDSPLSRKRNFGLGFHWRWMPSSETVRCSRSSFSIWYSL